MQSMLELAAYRFRMFRSDAGYENTTIVLHQLRGNFHNLHWSFACAKDDLWKTSPQRAMRIHRGETEVRNWRGLKCLKHCFAAGAAGAKLFKQLNGF